MYVRALWQCTLGNSRAERPGATARHVSQVDCVSAGRRELSACALSAFHCSSAEWTSRLGPCTALVVELSLLRWQHTLIRPFVPQRWVKGVEKKNGTALFVLI